MDQIYWKIGILEERGLISARDRVKLFANLGSIYHNWLGVNVFFTMAFLFMAAFLSINHSNHSSFPAWIIFGLFIAPVTVWVKNNTGVLLRKVNAALEEELSDYLFIEIQKISYYKIEDTPNEDKYTAC